MFVVNLLVGFVSGVKFELFNVLSSLCLLGCFLSRCGVVDYVLYFDVLVM